MSARRIECMGTSIRPCPGHAWWYDEGRGRPRLRCYTCRVLHRRIARAESSPLSVRRFGRSDRGIRKPRCLFCGYAGSFCQCAVVRVHTEARP